MESNSQSVTERSAGLSLRWGTYRLRLWLGIALVFIGAIFVLFTSTYTLPALLIGIMTHIVGWCILPSAGWKRICAAIASTFVTMILLNGSSATVFLSFSLAGWFLVLGRPWQSYLALAIPALSGLLLVRWFTNYGNYPVLFGLMALILIASAWVGRLLARLHSEPSAKSR